MRTLVENIVFVGGFAFLFTITVLLSIQTRWRK